MPIVPSRPIEISGSLLPFGNKRGVMVKPDGEPALVRDGSPTMSESVTIALAIMIAAGHRRAKTSDREA